MQSQHKESSGDSNEKKPLQPNSGAATKEPLDNPMIEMKATDSSEEDEDDVDDAELKGDDDLEGNEDGDQSNFFKLRREKRLAMNRASARARRKRNKVLLSTLSTQVSDLTQKNRNLQEANEKLIDKVQQLEAALQQSQSVLGNLISQQDHLASAGLAGNSPLTGLHGENHELFRSLLNHPSSSMSGSMLGTPLTPATPSMPTSNLRELLLKAQMSQLLQNPSASHLEAAAAAAEMRMQLQSQSEMGGGGATGASPISRLLGRLSQHNAGPPQLPVLASTGGGGTGAGASLQSSLLGQASGAGNALDGLDMLGRRGQQQGLKRKAEDDAERVIADALRRTGR
eukprot:Nitzschia sp. Nitz4//scaffold23_size168460//50670//51695//NITZ4_002211-RA/size168460-processed-gene-0.251-mRNA-1//-1//CDS//3329543611//3135//frame0